MGFEPMKELPLYTLSKRAPSTTRPPLHLYFIKNSKIIIENRQNDLALLIEFKVQYPINKSGEVAEWLKAHAWKACIGETLSWVRIPFSPPFVMSKKAYF